MAIRPRRSVLYMPGANERALEKTRTLAADCLILDLEDSVAPEAKDQARSNVAAAVMAGGHGRREVVIRINGLDTPWGAAGLKMAIEARAHAILVPKVETPADLLEIPSEIHLWAMIEKPFAIFNARDIAASSRVSCLVLGTNDLLKETRASAVGGRFAIVPWLSLVVLAGRAHGLDVIDGVYNNFRDEAGFRAECEQGRDLGMDGKTLIHPAQIEICNASFSPAAQEIAWSARIIETFALPENASKGVITVDGKMVERLHLAMAERTVEIAKAIGHV
jgi:citrate lyase subunit beta / citryl-CoA lyase